MAFGVVLAKTERSKSGNNLTKVSKLSTFVNFDDRLVGGKYQFSTEAITKVENDKSLEDLVGARKDFNDKVKLYEDFK